MSTRDPASWRRLAVASVTSLLLGLVLVFAGVTARQRVAPGAEPTATATATATGTAGGLGTAEAKARSQVATVAVDVPSPGPPAVVTIHHRIDPGDTLGGILGGYGVDVNAVRAAALDLHDLASLRVGRDLDLVYDGDAQTVICLRYALGEDDLLVVDRSPTPEGPAPAPGWTAHLQHATYQTTTDRLQVTVDTTLWDAAIQAGLRAADVVALSEVFQSDIDFNTEVQAGAVIELVVLRMVRDDGFTKLGPPLAARFTNKGQAFLALRYTPTGSDKASYYDQEGFSRKGAFLRSPLAFSRVTSGFSTGRYHPLLKKKRPHWGTDFGAPIGTPVRSVARGRVTIAGRHGGHGNYVEVQHDGPYRTSYSHLSRISVRKGQMIDQGEKVGEVGTTGLSTGPHLHFQLWISDKHVDAMKADLPHNERLSAADLPAFEELWTATLPVLDGRLDPRMLDPAGTAAEPESSVVIDDSNRP